MNKLRDTVFPELLEYYIFNRWNRKSFPKPQWTIHHITDLVVELLSNNTWYLWDNRVLLQKFSVLPSNTLMGISLYTQCCVCFTENLWLFLATDHLLCSSVAASWIKQRWLSIFITESEFFLSKSWIKIFSVALWLADDGLFGITEKIPTWETTLTHCTSFSPTALQTWF